MADVDPEDVKRMALLCAEGAIKQGTAAMLEFVEYLGKWSEKELLKLKAALN